MEGSILVNSRSLISSIVYPLLTVLPFIILLQNVMGDRFYISGLYPVATVILLLIIYPVFRVYCNRSKYEFEASECVSSNRIIIFSIIISSVISMLLLEDKIFFIFTAFPIFLLILFSYWLTSIEIIRDESTAGLIRVMNNHLKFYTLFIQIYIVVKMIALIAIHLWNYYSSYLFFPFILSFIADFILLITLRNLMYSHNLRQESISEKVRSRRRGSISFILLLFIGFFSMLAGKSKSLLSYKYIDRFINWIDDLASTEYTGREIKAIESRAKDVELFEFMSTNEVAGKNMNWVWAFIEKLIVVSVVLLIVFFVFYPLLSPLIKKNGIKISFKDYYLGFIRSIKDFLSSLFSVVTPGEYNLKIDVKNKIYANKKNYKKNKREINKILRLYIRILNWAKKRKGVNISSYLSVTDIFISIPVSDRREEEQRDKLSMLFNKAFFSCEPIHKSDYSLIKTTFKEFSG